MHEEVDAVLVALSRSPALHGVAEEVLCASLSLWSAVDLRPGVMLWMQGRPADALALVQAGELDVVVDGTVIDRVGAGELIGAGAIFMREATRIASLRASRRTQVLVLWSAGLRRLRSEQSPLYAALLQHALSTAVRRGRALDRQLGQVRQGNFAAPEGRASSGLLARLMTLLGSGPDPAECPPVAELLARQPMFVRAPEPEREALVRAFTAVPFRAGELLTRQGETDERVLVLAAGTADVMRALAEQGGALLLERLEPGAIVGVEGLVAGAVRSASTVATRDGWIHVLGRAAVEQLPATSRWLWLELVLGVALARCRAAAHALQSAIRVFASRHEELMPSPPGVALVLGGLERAGSQTRARR